MYKIILAYCLVVAALAEGLLLDGKYLEQEKVGDIVKEYKNRLNKIEKDLNKNVRELNRALSKIPHRTCQYNIEEPIKLETHCFYPKVILCKRVMTGCVLQAYLQLPKLWKDAVKTKDELVKFIENFEHEFADCRQLLAISAAKYNECVTDVNSRGNDFIMKNQMQFNNQMDNALQKQKDTLNGLENSVKLFKSNQTRPS